MLCGRWVATNVPLHNTAELAVERTYQQPYVRGFPRDPPVRSQTVDKFDSNQFVILAAGNNAGGTEGPILDGAHVQVK